VRNFLILVAVLHLAGCADPESQAPFEDEGTGIEREITGFSVTETHEGKPAWELNSEYAWRIPRDPQVRLKNVEVVFFGAEGQETSRLTALRGIVNEDSGEMTARDRVRLVSSEGDTLTTDELVYSREEDRIHGPGFVRLAKPDRVLTGIGFEANPDLTDYEVREDVTITFIDNRGTPKAGS
jgi:LPS export ABC transporter protein LptC